MEVLRQWPFIVPRRVVTCAADWVVRRQKTGSWFGYRLGPWYKEIHPAETHVLARWPAERGEESVEFFTTRVWLTPPCGLFYLDGAYVLSPHGAILSSRRELFDEFSHLWNMGSIRNSSYFAPFATFSVQPKRLNRLAATVAVIGAENYYHWMFNLLPRFHLLAEVKDIVDYVFLPPVRAAFQTESLQAVGLPVEKMIQLDQGLNYVCERIFVPSIGPHDGSVPRWSVDYLRSLFLPKEVLKPAVGRKLYLSRGTATYKRSVVNEPEVCRLMIDLGFEIIVPHALTIREQAAIYAQASYLVGPHGAAFSNMVFSTNATVAEIFSPGYVAVGCYHSLAATCGHRYDYFLGEAAGSDGVELKTTVNLDRLGAWITGLLDNETSP